MKFLIHFAGTYASFRIPEFESVLRVLNLHNVVHYDLQECSDAVPFMVVDLPGEVEARQLASRAILIKAIYRYWGHAPSLERLLEECKNEFLERGEEVRDLRWRFEWTSFGHQQEKAADVLVPLIARFTDAMAIRGPVDLKRPEIIFHYIDCYIKSADGKSRVLDRVYYGTHLCDGPRKLIDKYSLKRRTFVSTTSMDPELSLITANQALCRPGTLVLDPFCGTGSFLLTCAEFGSYCVGSDLDGRQIRAKTKWMQQQGRVSDGLESLAREYGLEDRILGAFVSDFKVGLWRELPRGSGYDERNEIFDAIVSDPPYGVRAGAKKIASAPCQVKPSTAKIPLMTAYDLEEMFIDMVNFAARHLKPGGRLVTWFPTVTEEFVVEDVPRHPYLDLVANSVQEFGKWERRLITMEKKSREELTKLSFTQGVQAKAAPAHAQFRVKYFEGFKPATTSAELVDQEQEQ